MHARMCACKDVCEDESKVVLHAPHALLTLDSCIHVCMHVLHAPCTLHPIIDISHMEKAPSAVVSGLDIYHPEII